MDTMIDDAAAQLLFTDARTHAAWTDRPVEPATLRALYERLRWGPTAMNTQPIRLVFVCSAEAKQRLLPGVDAGNVEKTLAAPVTAIVAWDTAFYSKLPQLVPNRPGADARIAALPEERREATARNGAWLQAGYLILAARSLGLDCGPMGGFQPALVNEAFFPGDTARAVLLVNLGYGDTSRLTPRAPRLAFDEACRVE